MEIHLLQVAPIGTNCYLVCDEQTKRCAVVDPGGDAARIDQAVRTLGQSVEAIFLTHGHYDHTGGVAELRQLWPSAAVYLNHRDVHRDGDAYVRQLFPALPGEICDYDEGDTVTVGNLTFTVLATPGHTAGGVTLRCGDALLCGDTLFAGSCGRTDLLGGDMAELLLSLKRLGQLEGNLTVLPGHMDPSDLNTERASNPYLRQAMEQGV